MEVFSHLPFDISTSASPTTSFEPFPRLPFELRVEIWMAILDSHSQSFGMKNHFYPPRPNVITICPTVRPPALLHTNQEARRVTQRHYSQIFTTSTSTSDDTKDLPQDDSSVYVNFSTDVFSAPTFLPASPSDALKRIQRLRMTEKEMVYLHRNFAVANLDKLEALRELEITVSLKDHRWVYQETDNLIFAFEAACGGKPGWILPRIKLVFGSKLERAYEGGAWGKAVRRGVALG